MTSPTAVSGKRPEAANEQSCCIGGVLGLLQLGRERRIALRQVLDQPLARGLVGRLAISRIAAGEELLLLQLDPLPRRVAERHVEAAAGEDLGELERPVEEAVLLRQLERGLHDALDAGLVAQGPEHVIGGRDALGRAGRGLLQLGEERRGPEIAGLAQAPEVGVQLAELVVAPPLLVHRGGAVVLERLELAGGAGDAGLGGGEILRAEQAQRLLPLAPPAGCAASARARPPCRRR